MTMWVNSMTRTPASGRTGVDGPDAGAGPADRGGAASAGRSERSCCGRGAPGAVVDIVCLYKLSGWLGGTYLYEIVPGFAAGFVFAVVATLVTKKPGAEVDAIFDKATA